VAQRIAQGQKPAWRFLVPTNTAIEFIDVVKGPQHFQSNDIGDFIVRRADGTAPFLFCNAIDDALMSMSHVLRGEDHLANTLRQIMLLKALHLAIPQYGHLSLIVGDDNAPLSKRHGSFSLHEMRTQGFLPVAIINYLGRLGHASEVRELLDFSRLAEHFYLEKLNRSPAHFDGSQLLYWQKIAVQALDIQGLYDWLGKEVVDQIPESARLLFAKTVQANIEFPRDALHWANIFFHEEISMGAEEKEIICVAGEQFFVEAQKAVDQYGVELERVLASMKQVLGVSGKKLFMPLRVALTGKVYGPGLIPIAELLGSQKLKYRLSTAFQLASKR
jgi:glutamyl-tRNA synthetase